MQENKWGKFSILARRRQDPATPISELYKARPPNLVTIQDKIFLLSNPIILLKVRCDIWLDTSWISHPSFASRRQTQRELVLDRENWN